MSGFYQNWIKVQQPELSNNIPPMQSGGSQTPFFFGGSQVPINLGMDNTDLNITGNGLANYNKLNFRPILSGKGIQSSNYHRQSNIHIPRQMGILNKGF